ncbi:MAG: Crp/Fnr family transcriptional regulator [Oceanospirillaceae bacterium]
MIRDTYIRQLVYKHHLFSNLAEAEFEKLMEFAVRLQLNPQQNLFFQGDPAKRFYLLLHGNLQLYRSSPQGQNKVIEVVREGKIFAEALMFERQSVYPVSAQAVSQCQLISLDSESYRNLLLHNNAACMAVMSNMTVRLRRHINEIELLSLQNAQSRLLLFLMQHMQSTSKNQGQVSLDIPKRLLASLLSIQPETFSRLMKKMIASNLIYEQGHDIIIKDVNKLYESVELLFEPQ